MRNERKRVIYKKGRRMSIGEQLKQSGREVVINGKIYVPAFAIEQLRMSIRMITKIIHILMTAR